MLIACKYEEIYPPSLKEFVAICDKAYTSQQILEMEADILMVLKMELTHSSSLKFIDRYAQVAEIETKAYYFARYLIETVLLEYSMLKYKNSLIAAGAIFLVNKIFKKHGWTETLTHHTGYTEAEVKPCAKDLYFTMQNSEKLILHAIKRKFSSSKYLEVSKYRIEKVPSTSKLFFYLSDISSNQLIKRTARGRLLSKKKEIRAKTWTSGKIIRLPVQPCASQLTQAN